MPDKITGAFPGGPRRPPSEEAPSTRVGRAEELEAGIERRKRELARRQRRGRLARRAVWVLLALALLLVILASLSR